MSISNPASKFPGGSEAIIGRPGIDGKDGKNGLSAYEIAIKNGYVGSEADWLDSLIGPPGVDGFDGERGASGLSAYEIAKKHGFKGTEKEWLDSLVGGNSYTPIEGDVPVKAVTSDEYNALPESEKDGSILWVIINDEDTINPPTLISNQAYRFGHGFITAASSDNVVDVEIKTVSDFSGDNTLPIQAAAVQTLVGNIDALLATI